MRPLNHSTMPLVLSGSWAWSAGVRCPAPRTVNSNYGLPAGSRSCWQTGGPVNSLPLSVSSLVILIGQVLCSAFQEGLCTGGCLVGLELHEHPALPDRWPRTIAPLRFVLHLGQITSTSMCT